MGGGGGGGQCVLGFSMGYLLVYTDLAWLCLSAFKKVVLSVHACVCKTLLYRWSHLV